ncbi:hypothetical protein LQW54_007253 [Pestalotiopsis sp. IQ-011]
MSSELKANAKRIAGNQSRPIDDKVYDHSKITMILGGFQMPVNPNGFCPGRAPNLPDLTVAVPSDLALRLRDIWWTSGDSYNPQKHQGTSLDFAKAGIGRYMTKFEGGQLLDLPAADEYELRRIHGIYTEKNIAQVFGENRSVIPGTFTNWDPTETVVELGEDRNLHVFYRDSQGNNIMRVDMLSYRE